MPSTKKTLHFMSSALITCVSVGLLGYGMSEEWSKTTMDCTNDGGGYFNGTAVVTLALFKGTVNRVSCPTFGGANDFQGNFQRLSKGQVTKNCKICPHFHTSGILVLFSLVFETSASEIPASKQQALTI